MSESDEFSVRLDNIQTQWTMIRRAHQGTMVSGSDARQALVMRYAPAIRRYLGALTRDDEQAEELAQDVMVRILSGDFAGADPDRGRFRDLLKTAIRNMVRNYWAKLGRRRQVDGDALVEQIADDDSARDDDDPWLQSWRANLLHLAWTALERYQTQTPGSAAYTVLKLRADFPNDDSAALAERLSRDTGKPFRADAVRQQLRRARVRFAELLVEEIAQGLDQPTPQRVQDELISLGLYEHIRDVLPEQWRGVDRQ